MPAPLFYTFGNHMHWVDMEWLWGYHVLPGSVRDMLTYCAETGAKGNVNFDGVGYEKLAAESPEALASLRKAVSEGIIEPVGCSYGQPYGLFHGGESNVRQLIYGARAVRRLLGVWPRTFWEEEFYFFPQLPQMLRSCGFEYASLFFQWTWHTPEVPRESDPVIWWVGVDGSQLLTATRNNLNMHQWPEDVDSVLASIPEGEGGFVQQWLELMPSPDWMCRSEVLLPRMKELLADPRFTVQFGTLSECIKKMAPADRIPARTYSMDEVWHGLTLGKNGDRIRQKSRFLESWLLALEHAYASLSLLGRPYPQWDVYPVWEFEEAWRKLLRAQHHDNCECEGLCARVAYADYAWIESWILSLLDKLSRKRVEHVHFEWHQKGNVHECETAHVRATVDFESGSLRVKLDQETEVKVALFAPESVGPQLHMSHLRQPMVFAKEGDTESNATIEITPDGKGVEITFTTRRSHRDKGGYQGARHVDFSASMENPEIWTDTPYHVGQVQGTSRGVRKYPEGDWMTSPQWFEEVENGIFASSFLALKQGSRSVQIRSSSPAQWFHKDGIFRFVRETYDPWDEDDFATFSQRTITISFGQDLTPADWWRKAHEPISDFEIGPPGFEAIACPTPNMALTAFYRESENPSGYNVQHYAGTGMEYPFIARLVELNGEACVAELHVAGNVAAANKANLLGEVSESLNWESGKSEVCVHPKTGSSSIVAVPLRPFEIATVYFDVEEGRKVPRDLDAKREVWAQVHRTG